MNLETKLARGHKSLEKNKQERPSSSADIIATEDTHFDLEEERGAVQVEDTLELAKVRASLGTEGGDNNRMFDSLHSGTDSEDEEIIAKPKNITYKSHLGLFTKLASNRTLGKIILGLGFTSVATGEVGANIKSSSEKTNNKHEQYSPNASESQQIEDTTFIVGNNVENLLTPDEIEELANEKFEQEAEAKFVLTKEEMEEAYRLGTFDKINGSDDVKLLLKNAYKLDSLDYEMSEKIDEVADNNPEIFIKEAHNFLNKPGVNTNGIIEQAVGKSSPEVIEAFLENYGNLKNIPDLRTEELMNDMIKKDAWTFLTYGHKLGGQMSVEELTNYIDKASESSPYVLFSQIRKYAKIPGLDIEQLVKKHSVNYPLGVVASAPFLRRVMSEPDLIKMLEDAAPKVEPASFLLAFPECKNIKSIASSEILNKTLLDAATAIPGNFIGENVSVFKEMSKMSDADIVKIANQLESSSPAYYLEQIRFLKNVKGLDLSKSINSIYNKDKDTKRNFLMNAGYFVDIPNLDLATKIEEVGRGDKGTFLTKAETFKNVPGLDLGKLITEFAPAQGSNFLYSASQFKDIKNLDLPKLITEIAPFSQNERDVFLSSVDGFKDIKNLDLVGLINKTAPLSGQSFIYSINNFKNIPGLDVNALINRIAPQQSKLFLENIKDFKDIPNLNLGNLVNLALPEQAGMLLEIMDDIKDIPGVKFDVIIDNLSKQNPRFFLANINIFNNIIHFDTEKTLLKMVDTHPNLIIENAECLKCIKDKTVKLETIERVFSLYPEGARNNKKLLDIVENPQLKVNQVLKKMQNMNAILLLDDMVKNNMSEEEALAITGDSNKLLPKLLDIKARPDHLAKVAIDESLASTCRELVLDINFRHTLPDEPRFKSIASFSSRELYTTMVYGEDEIYTSSFNGCFDRLVGRRGVAGRPGIVGKMETEKINGRDLLDQVGDNKFRTFVKECTWFNRLEEFLGKMDKKDSDALLKNVVKNIETTDNKLDNALTLAEIFGGTKDPSTLQLLQEQVKVEVERLSKDEKAAPEDKVMYNLLAGMFKDNAIVDKEWFAKIAQEYPMGKVTNLDSKELFNENGLCVQKYHFYEGGDKDGVTSFQNFIDTYKADTATWKIDDSNTNYVVITGKNGARTIEIYANNPNAADRGKEGLNEIDELISGKQLTVNLYSYRGHSTNVSLDGVTEKTKIINLGSCGGFNRVNEILDLSPESHVISTKGTGTKYVNDPIFKDLNDDILAGKDIDWRQFWDKQAKKLSGNPNFGSYVPPHKNQGMMYMKAFREKTNIALNESLAEEE